MEADPASLVTISASGVVAIALANTVLVLLSTVLSQVFAPSRHDLVKMLEDDLAHLGRHPFVVSIIPVAADTSGMLVPRLLRWQEVPGSAGKTRCSEFRLRKTVAPR
jgi:hypothetical protein